MVPKGWKLTSLGEVCSGSLQTGPFGSQLHAHEYTDEGVPVLMPKDLINYRANNESAAKIPEHRADDLKKHTLQSGDLLFSRRGDVARFALIESDYPRSLCGTGCLKATPNKAHSPLFLSYFLQKNAVKKWLEQNAVGQTMPNMNTAILAELPLMVASSREEEDKIAKILSTWDKAISTTEKLIETSMQQKKALMQQLLTGKKRLVNPETGKAFEGEWTYKSINEVATRIQKKSDGEAHPILTISSLRGFVTQEDRYSRYMAGESVKNYILLKRGEFAYNKGNSKTYQFGCIFDLETFDTGLVPHVYVCFKLNKGLNHRYFKYLFEADYLKPQLGALVNTGVRNNGLLNIKPTEFMNTKVPVPCFGEQERIADVLHASSENLKILNAKLAHFKQEKKALMQQLLTGKRRVKVDEEVAA
ncbi:restriction endonuclease subunit S [Vibrio sp. Vb1554]|uniref:restriction endonuclease subunit S n=1 Tax=Vibrio sp. Vb1554 TaxID=3074642 RepID=UPI002965D1FD|nr:restriction endonuclease subunit S [Vibrio sp. Vb1554]MDW3048251.1 restriction endonuclease subunit S [Vibrio sp. Vb1554]